MLGRHAGVREGETADTQAERRLPDRRDESLQQIVRIRRELRQGLCASRRRRAFSSNHFDQRHIMIARDEDRAPGVEQLQHQLRAKRRIRTAVHDISELNDEGVAGSAFESGREGVVFAMDVGDREHGLGEL